MKKTTKQILKKAAKYGAVYTLGVATVVALWCATHVPPEKRACGGPVPYNVEVNGVALYGYDLCRELTSALAYLYEPIYVFQRRKGIEMLENLAAQGVINSMNNLARYYRQENKFDTALYWSRIAARHGDPMFLAGHLYRWPQDLSVEDIQMLEGFGVRHSGVAIVLANYFKERDLAKYEKWLNHHNTGKDFLPLPADTIITLKQRIYPFNMVLPD